MFKSKMAVLVGMLAVSGIASADLSTGLIAHWSFDDCTGKDVSGNGHDGTIQNDVTCVDGVISKALHLQGQGYVSTAGGYLSLPSIDFMNMPNYSICLWSKEEGMSYGDGEAYIWFGNHSYGNVSISHFGNNIQFYNGTDAVTVPFLSTDKNKFIHYCLSYANSELKAYKNGSFIGSIQQQTLVASTDSALGGHWWGNGGGGSSTRFIGSLDDVRIYNMIA